MSEFLDFSSAALFGTRVQLGLVDFARFSFPLWASWMAKATSEQNCTILLSVRRVWFCPNKTSRANFAPKMAVGLISSS